MKISNFCLAGILCLCPVAASAGDIKVDAWARATPPGGSSGAIYGSFTNEGESAASVEKVSFEHAHHVMIHQTVEEAGMARMRHSQLSMNPGESEVLKPGGTHIMLMGLSEPLKQGCIYQFSLHWAGGETTRHEFLVGTYGQAAPPEMTGVACP